MVTLIDKWSPFVAAVMPIVMYFSSNVNTGDTFSLRSNTLKLKMAVIPQNINKDIDIKLTQCGPSKKCLYRKQQISANAYIKVKKDEGED